MKAQMLAAALNLLYVGALMLLWLVLFASLLTSSLPVGTAFLASLVPPGIVFLLTQGRANRAILDIQGRC